MTLDATIVETGEVVDVSRPGLGLPGRFSAVGVEFPEAMTFEEWQAAGETLKGVERSLMWWIGDWLKFGERRWGERYTAAMEATGKDYGTLRNAVSVAREFGDLSRRRDKLSWSHHAEVAALSAPAADALLDQAEAEGWTRNEMRQRVSQAKVHARILAPQAGAETVTLEDLDRLVVEGRRFGAIYADPPWLYDNQGTRAATGNHYEGMTVDDLCELPIRQLAADASHLHMWTTNAFLFDCRRIFDAWGFEFKSTFVWVKPEMGIGNYWRNSHEILLTAVRGDAKRFNDHSIMSWLHCGRGKHSAKPEKVREYIERASPGPYLELFGRAEAKNWTVWGNQIRRTLFDASLREVA